MKKSVMRTISILCFLLSSFIGISFAGDVSVFGPKQYVRTTGSPDVYTDTFTGLFTEIVNSGKLIVLNGNQVGDRRIEDAINSAEIFVNGELIFGPSDFNQHVYYLEAPIALGENNSILIELRSNPGSYLTIEVVQDLDPPTISINADPDAIKVNEDSILTWNSLLADTCSIEPDIGSVDVNGSMTVSPDDTTTYTITASGPGGVSTASITITHVNSAPVADDQTVPTDEDTPASITLTASDLDGEPLVYQVLADPIHGTLAGQVPNLTYTPDENYYGTDSFTFKANDGLEDSNIATVSLTINPVNDPPVAVADSAVTDEDIPVTTANVLANDTDVEGDILTVSDFTQPANGTVAYNGDGTFTYTPDLNFNGSDSFSYMVNDGNGGTDSTMVIMTVNPVNDTPVADDQTVEMDEDEASFITLTASDVDLDNLTFQVVANPTHGLLSGDAPDLTYTPDANYHGTDSFTFKANDGTEDSNTATVSLTINPVNDPPVANDDTATTDEDLSVTTGNVLTNDVDVDGDLLTIAGLTQAANGTVVDNGDGTFTYTPDQDFGGTDGFTYTVSDGNGSTDTALVTLTVNPINDPPVANDDAATTDEDSPVTTGNVLANDTDPDGDLLSIAGFTQATNGTVVDNGNGTFTYTPNQDFGGTDGFTYTVSDGNGGTDTAMVTVTVNPVNDQPIADDQSIALDENTSMAITLTGSDRDGDTLTYQIMTGPVNGTLIGTAPNLTYTPTVNYNGPDSFTFKVNDGTVNSDPATVSLQVNSTNDPPVANDDTATTYQDTAGIIDLLANDTDPDQDILSITGLTQPSNGTVTNNGNGTVTYTPNPNYTGSDIFTYTISDGNGGTDTAVVQVTVSPPPEMDLEPTSIDVSGVTIDPQTLEISGDVALEIRNNGADEVTQSYGITFFEDIDNNQIFDPASDNVLGTGTLAGGPPGGDSLTISVTISGTARFVNNLIYAFVDTADEIPETDETNNVTHNMVTCEYIPPVGSFDPVLEWEWTGSSVYPSHNQVMSAPVVANLNDDNGDGVVDENDTPDIIFNTFAGGSYLGTGILRAISGDGSGELFAVSHDYYTNATSNPVVGDIDGDGLVEIITVSVFKQIYAFENDGSHKWTSEVFNLLRPHSHGPVIADLQNDGVPEIIIGKVVLNNDGTTRWIGAGSQGANDHSIVADTDIDGHPEIIAGNTKYDINGNIIWQNASLPGGKIGVADFDGDPFAEIVLVGGGAVYLLEHTGDIVWGPIPLPGGGSGSPPTIADYDNDGAPEIGVADRARYSVFETDGSIRWTNETADYSSSQTGSSVFDFDGDGNAEVVYSDELYLRIYRGYDGAVLFQTPVGSGTLLELPVIVDVDNDNNAEIVVASNNYYHGPKTGIQVYGDANDTWVNTRKIWNQHAYSITNVNDDGTIPQYVTNNWEVFNNFRQNQMLNPFGCIDITASYLRVDMSLFPNSSTITARIGNGGALAVVPGLDVPFYDGDPEAGGTLLGTVQSVNRLEPGTYEDISFQWNNPAPGIHTIYVQADDDGTGNGKVSETDEANNITYAAFNLGNNGPTANAGPDLTVFVGSTVSLDGTGSSDPDGDSITYQWSITYKPVGSAAILFDDSSPTPTFVVDEAGTYDIQLVVTDGFLSSGPDFVTITVSPVILVPDVVGQPQANAEAAITAANLIVGAVTTANSNTVPLGCVVSQNPVSGTNVFINSAVDLLVSLGPIMVTVPDVVGQAQANAEAAITAVNLTVGTITTANSATVPAGNVISQNPAGGASVAEGSSVDLVVSLGPLMVTVPDVVGLSLSDAEFDIQTTGLVVGGINHEYSDTVPTDHVISQSPAPGVSLPESSAVDFVVSLGVQMVTVPDVTGMVQMDAETAITNADLTVGIITEEYIDIVPQGRVISQNPASGTTVASGTYVNLNVSLGVWDGVDEDPPNVTISAEPSHVNLTDSVTITVLAWDNVGVVDRILTVNGTVLPLVGNEAVYTADTAGYITAEVTATDAAGLNAMANTIIAVTDPNDTTPPVVSLDDMDFIDVTDLHTITGSVSDDTGVTYELQSREKGSLDWITFAQGSGISFTGDLGVFDATVRRNGVHEIRLYAEDLSGNTAFVSGGVVVDGELKLGSVIIPTEDTTLPQPGFPLSLVREYDSRAEGGDFGPGWNLPSTNVKPSATNIPGEGWDQESQGGVFPTYYLLELKRHVIVIRFSDSDVIKFEMDVNPKSNALYPLVYLTVDYTPVQGTQGTLEALDFDRNVVLNSNELWEYGADLYNPQRFRLTRPDGSIYIVSQSGIESMTDPYGHTISYGVNGISHSSGASLTFERGAGNRIEEVTDPLGGKVQYIYDQDGMLERVVQVKTAGIQKRLASYAYAMGIAQEPVLQTIKAPDGTELGQFEYDASGRMTALIDADGNRVLYGYDLPNHEQVITDRRGNETLYEYDNTGNVTSKTDPLGNVTQWTYDSQGNMLTETNPSGETTTRTYDANDNMLTETDPLGNTTTYTYNSRNQVLTVTDALNNTTTNTYDTYGNLLTTTDPHGNITTNIYDPDGNLESTTDPFGNITTYTYDTNGNRITETDPLGVTTTYIYDGYGNELTKTVTRTTNTGPVVMTTTKEYDDLNQLIKETDPDGNFTQTAYNAIGKQSAVIDKNGSRTEYAYDPQGNLIQSIFPDGTTESHTYDEEGNRLSSTDKASRTTIYEYDALNRLILTTHPDSSITEMEYDGTGRLVASIDENANRTDFAYDEAGRRNQVTDALGNVTSFTYDENGNQLTMTDANDNTTAYTYDALNRRTQTTFPDGTFTTVAYDAMGRKVSETDQASNTTQFEYDPMGRLTAVIDALGGETTYTYDEVGNKLTQTDPNVNTTTWEYDNSGRVVAHTLPLGMSEAFTYDAVGNMLSRTDFNGDTTTYTYDVCCSRLLTTSYPDSTQVTYTYTHTDRKETVTDARGVTSYTYDLRDRLLTVQNPDGSTLAYTYDAKGNRTSVTIPSGTTFSTYDALNRLETVTDPDGGETTYAYDNVGNRTSVTYPNGTLALYTYDTLNRLTYLENRTSTSDIISGYTYTLGPAGNRTKVVDHSGRMVDYSYDALYRLTGEDITDPVLGNETISYTYDSFGNRLTKTDSGGTINYTYDANDRLLSEGINTYTYDENGNTLSKSDSADTTDYFYDYENRLISAQTPTSLIDYEYDADGIRVAFTLDGAVTNYLVDKNRDYAQVLEERDGANSLIVSYVYGDDLISQERNGADSYYHYDGQMSTRGLTDATETVIATYIYDAFGLLIDQTGTTENNYLYSGEQYDPNVALYYLRARYYDQATGRFLTTDPAKGKIFEPATLHKYLYAANNPVMLVDPSGEFSIVQKMAIVTISGILASEIHSCLHHLLSRGWTPIEWRGTMLVDVYGAGPSAGGILVMLSAQDSSGRTVNANYMLWLVGLGGGISLSSSEIVLYTPGALGANPRVLEGPVTYIAFSIVRVAGPGYTILNMGMGRSDRDISSPDLVVGPSDVGFDIVVGWSQWLR